MNLLRVAGDLSSLRDALIQIVLRLETHVLKDRDGGHNPAVGAESVYPGSTGLPLPSVLPSVPQMGKMATDQCLHIHPSYMEDIRSNDRDFRVQIFTWGDRIAHISGTVEQKRTAENLIQAFIMAI
ncbi:hypothetical protein J5N97_000098 [Dioscorea zingiberensis]|uniref:Uncharacterized protein n=1 Tax=Dioscorea zingiberensis TaxID=325984 RepID=A0A9D5BTB1_9LILI|nr:hypothetical protein J5N97_000098 [Dioscorea zingiberensis]